MEGPQGGREARKRAGIVASLVVALASALALLPASDAASQLPSQGTISGTVTDANGAPIEDICVTGWSNSVWPSETDASGEYEISVSPGTYKIEFTVCEGGNHVDEWFDDQPDRDAATPISIVAGQTVEADATLATGGMITGTVTGPGDQPLEGACVAARRQQDAWSHYGVTDQDGDYVIEGLASGDYQVVFLHCDAGSYINEYYDDQPEETATPVPVTVGQTTASIDAELATGATISGRVIGLSGAPVENVCVHAHLTEFEFGAPYDRTDANGDYAIEGLPGGVYRVIYVPCGPGPYGLEWFDNAADWASAEPVTATVGSITGGIDADLSTHPPTPPPPPDPTPPAALPDTAAPDVAIGSGPSGKTTSRRPSFAFGSGDPSARFECALDALDPTPCTSPAKQKQLKYGRHTFSVVAIDPAGNRSPAAQRRFKVTKKPRKGH